MNGCDMKRIMLRVAYDGTNYHGWQLQLNGITIEQVLNETLSDLLKEPITVIGASRTDSGVHSLGNVAVFDTNTRIPPEKITYALNQRLPKDIVVQESDEVEPGFHPRRCESIKTYEYRILNRKLPLPTLRRDTYFFYRPLDIVRMQQAALYFKGKHDFKSFCSANTQATDTIREIFTCDVKKEGDIISIRISGSGFLYHMVRIIAGTLIWVGICELEPEAIAGILKKKNREAAGPTSPAHGLTMIGIEYKESVCKKGGTE